MGDGFQLHNGKFLVDAAGFAAHSDCCCVDCANCTGASITAVVTVAGACDAFCANAAGTDTELEYEPCKWAFHTGLTLTVWINAGRIYAAIATAGTTYFGDPTNPSEYKDVTGLVTCSGGNLIGAFALEGFNKGAGLDCSGCVANVTLT